MNSPESERDACQRDVTFARAEKCSAVVVVEGEGVGRCIMSRMPLAR